MDDNNLQQQQQQLINKSVSTMSNADDDDEAELEEDEADDDQTLTYREADNDTPEHQPTRGNSSQKALCTEDLEDPPLTRSLPQSGRQTPSGNNYMKGKSMQDNNDQESTIEATEPLYKSITRSKGMHVVIQSLKSENALLRSELDNVSHYAKTLRQELEKVKQSRFEVLRLEKDNAVQVGENAKLKKEVEKLKNDNAVLLEEKIQYEKMTKLAANGDVINLQRASMLEKTIQGSIQTMTKLATLMEQFQKRK